MSPISLLRASLLGASALLVAANASGAIWRWDVERTGAQIRKPRQPATAGRRQHPEPGVGRRGARLRQTETLVYVVSRADLVVPVEVADAQPVRSGFVGPRLETTTQQGPGRDQAGWGQNSGAIPHLSDSAAASFPDCPIWQK